MNPARITPKFVKKRGLRRAGRRMECGDGVEDGGEPCQKRTERGPAGGRTAQDWPVPMWGSRGCDMVEAPAAPGVGAGPEGSGDV